MKRSTDGERWVKWGLRSGLGLSVFHVLLEVIWSYWSKMSSYAFNPLGSAWTFEYRYLLIYLVFTAPFISIYRYYWANGILRFFQLPNECLSRGLLTIFFFENIGKYVQDRYYPGRIKVGRWNESVRANSLSQPNNVKRQFSPSLTLCSTWEHKC